MDMETVTQLKDMAVIWLATNGTKLLVALLIIFIGRLIAKKMANAFQGTLTRKNVDLVLAAFLRGLVFWVLLVAVLLVAADYMGLDITSFLAIVGTMGLAVGLAIKDNISNFANGVVLILTRPFTIGDYVEIAGVAGTVKDVSLSVTVLATPDNQKIIVPNAQILGSVIVNVTANDTRRIDLVVGIGYDDDIDTARNTLEEVLRAEEGVLETPAPVVAVLEMADSSVNFAVRPWCATSEYWNVRFRLTENIKKALDNASISIPYPQTDVHLHKAEQ